MAESFCINCEFGFEQALTQGERAQSVNWEL